MESNALSETLLFGLVALAIFGAYAFFLISRNARLKRRLWPAYAIGSSILIVAFFWSIGVPYELLYLVVPLFAVGALINLRVVKFCDTCGATINNARRAAWLLPPARVCPERGASLQQGGAPSTVGNMTAAPLTPRDQVVPAELLVAGIASHGWGMLQKHRLEAKADYAPASWETALYWVCWAALAVLLLLIGIRAFTG